MDIDWISSSIERTESDVEETVEKIEVIENKEQNIRSSIQKLQEDIEISGILSEKLSEKEMEKAELAEKVDYFRNMVRALEADINEMIDVNNESQSILEDLGALGENVQEGLNTIAERKLLIEKCTEELQKIMDRLDMAGAFRSQTTASGVASSASGVESSASGGGNSRHNAFLESLKSEPQKKSGSDDDTANGAASSVGGDPNKGEQEKVRGYSTDCSPELGILSKIASAWSEKVHAVSQTESAASGDSSGGIRNQILTGNVDPSIARFGWKRKDKAFSLEEDLKEVNPNYYTGNNKVTTDIQWTCNCQRCIMALEARFRGADVRAKPYIPGTGDNLPVMFHPDGWLSVFKNPNPVKCTGTTGLDTGAGVMREMKSYGDGARAIVRIQYSDTIKVTGPDGRPKTFVVEKQNNVDTVCDIITRKPVDLSSYYPGIDLSGGYRVEAVQNRYRPGVTEYVLTSAKDGTPICTVQKNQGHVFTAIQKNGQTVFCDGQTGKVIDRPESYFAAVKTNETYVVRVDNLAFTDRVKDCCESNI